MITFDDVKRTAETTFFFFPDGLATELRHFLREAGVPETDYEILSCHEVRGRYPGMTVPSVPYDPRFAKIPSALCDTPNLIVSHMDTADLERKLWEIHRSPDAKAWRRQCTDEIVTDMGENLTEMIQEAGTPDTVTGYDPETGPPMDKSYLERGLPPFLQESITAMRAAWDKLERGERYLGWDCDYCRLQSSINVAETDQLISSDQAWYLREKYLDMERP